MVDETGTVQAASDAVIEVFGYQPDELVGQPVEMLVPAASRSRHVGYRSSYTDHPEMRPMGVGLRLVGVRKDGTELPVDVSLVPSHSGGGLRVGAFVRDATLRRREEDLLRFVNEISRDALGGSTSTELYRLAAGQARTLVGAVASWIVVPAGREYVSVAAAAGPGTEAFTDVAIPLDESLSGQVMAGSGTLTIDDVTANPLVMAPAREAGLGPGLFIPMQAEHRPIGVLVVARGQGEVPFSAADVGIAEIFGSATAVVLALGQARLALEDARVTSEHERIARDLHDTVIQRLFAIGMRLQAAERLADRPIAERIGDTVENIDEVIREIRETIFDLNHPDRSGQGLRSEVRTVAAEAAQHLGFAPRINFRGAVEAAADESVCAQLIPVLREALANVSRHARASSADILISLEDGHLSLSVADDGVGVSEGPSAGHGTDNMRERAEKLGGEFSIRRRDPRGTVVRWTVPLSR